MSGGADYAGKPRPAVVLQDDRFDGTGSVILCPLTTNPLEAPLYRLAIQPSTGNGLKATSRLMIDKLTAVSRRKLGSQLGRLDDEDLVRLNRAVVVFLGLAGA